MPSRRVLKSVAHDVSESLVSRNDDVGGYWALGQLLSHALATSNSSYRVDLLRGASTPSLIGTPLGLVASSWADVFWKNVEHQKLSRAIVVQAVAIVDFNLDRPRPAAVHTGRVEYPFACRVEIHDDRGRAYTGTTEAWCHAHDPTVELRSQRGA